MKRPTLDGMLMGDAQGNTLIVHDFPWYRLDRLWRWYRNPTRGTVALRLYGEEVSLRVSLLKKRPPEEPRG